MSTSSEEINTDKHEVRLRAPSRKGYQNILLNRTSTFNKVTKNLQRGIKRVNISIKNPELLKEASDMLKESKEYYEKLVEENSCFFKANGAN